jgi:hypothetical protein
MNIQKRRMFGASLIIIGIILVTIVILNHTLSWQILGSYANKFFKSAQLIYIGLMITFIGLVVFFSKSRILYDFDRVIRGKFFGNQKINIKLSLVVFTIFEIFFIWLMFNTNCGGPCPNDFPFFVMQFLKGTFVSVIATIISYIAVVIRTAWWEE